MQTVAKSAPRLAIIGCGTIVEYASIIALRRIGWLPSVLVDGSQEPLDIISRKIGRAARVIKSSNWQSVVGEFDAALVALPHTLRGPVGAALLQAGKHVFMEPPLAPTANKCQEIIRAAHASGAILSVGLFRRYSQIACWTKALLQSELMGAIKRFNVREDMLFSSSGNFSDRLPLNPTDGGILTLAGTHTLDLLLWWLGDFESIKYLDDSEGGPEADCSLECELTSGANGRIVFSRTRSLRNSVRIEGTQGFVEVHLHNNKVLAGSPNALAFRHNGISPAEMKPQSVAELFDAELKDFRTGVLDARQTGVSGSDGARSVQLIERCYAARERLIPPWEQAAPAKSLDPNLTLPILPRGSKVLVTGATGFVGGRLVERLVHENDVQIRCLIRDVGRASRVARLPVELLRVDLSNANEIERAVDGIDYIFHCAYDTRSRRQNIEGLSNLIEASAIHSVQRLVQVSTFAVYEPFPDGPLTEQSPDGDRSNTYVDTKLDLEKMVFDAARNRGVAATIVQPSIVYGPFCLPWTNSPAEMLIFGDVILPDQGEGLCNAVYIDDVVDGLIRAAVSPAAVGERFIISGPQPVTWAGFFTEFARALGTKPPKFWPYERIADANHGIIRNLRLAVTEPKRLIKMIVRWRRVRQILQAALDIMPGPLRKLTTNYYFDPRGRRAGEMFLPSRQALAMYSSSAVASSEKACLKLGYKPRFDFQRGMMPTGHYLEWAYEDIRESVATGSKGGSSEGALSSSDITNAD